MPAVRLDGSEKPLAFDQIDQEQAMNKLFVTAVAAGMVGSVSLLSAGTAVAETAFIVPGTAPPAPGPLRTFYHFNPAMQPAIGDNYYDSADATREVIPYPGSLWPITGKDSPTLDQSVNIGTNNLDSAIRGTSGPMVTTGLSQGVLALNGEQARLANDPTAPAPDQLTFIKAGNPAHLFNKYFKPGSTVPVLDYTVQSPAESQYNTVEIVGQYDIFSDPLDRPGNVLALANAIIAGGLNHTATAFTNPADVAPQNVSVVTNSKGATTTTYYIPAEQLPLVQFLQQNGMSAGMAGDLDRVLRPMINRAYGPEQPRPSAPRWQPPDLRGVQPANIVTPISAPVNLVSAATNAANLARTVNGVRNILPKGKR